MDVFSSSRKVNILMFNMSTWADWQRGIVNRNYFVLQELLRRSDVDTILAVDFLHYRKRRLVKDYYQGVLNPHGFGKTIFRSILSRCSKKSDKLYIYSTVGQIFRPDFVIKELHALLNQLNMQENLIVWSFNPLFIGFSNTLNQNLNIFDTVDNWMTHGSFKSFQPLLRKNYQCISDTADIVFTVSTPLLEFYRTLGRNHHVFFVPNGVDLNYFTLKELHPVYQKQFLQMKRPILGYLGTINEDRVDLDLIAFVARHNPNATIVLAGPVWKGIEAAIHEKLALFTNVRYMSRIPYAQTAAVMNQFDVCLNPHQMNDFIRSTHPMKLYEYLAMGKPVVSTAHEGLELFSDVISFAESYEEFQKKITVALEDKDETSMKKRLEWVRNNTFEKRVEEMMQRIY